MRSLFVLTLFTAELFSVSIPVVAKEWPLDTPKGSTVVVKVPISLWETKEPPSFSTGAPIFNIDTAAVLDKPGWETDGLPYFGEFVVAKIFEFKPFYKLKYTDVELRNSSTWVKLRFPPDADIGKGFKTLTFTGIWSQFEATDYFRNAVFGTFASRVFTGKLAAIPDSVKLSLLRIAGSGTATVIPEEYKGKTYIAFEFPLPGTVYNSLKVNQEARAATIVNSRLNLIKEFASILSGTPIDGLEIKQKIEYRDFSSDTTLPAFDRLQVYAASKMIEQFASADITSQEFIDQCVVILNDNRVHLSLSLAI